MLCVSPAARRIARHDDSPKGQEWATPPPAAGLQAGENSHDGKIFRRGADLVLRRQVQRGILLKALTEQELRDIKSGKRVTGRAARRRAALIRGAMLEDMAMAYRRVTYAMAHLKGRELHEATMIANALTKLGDHIAEHLDQKPAGVTRSTEFVFSSRGPDHEVPQDADGRQLPPAEEGYEEIREEDAPRP